MIVFTLLPTQNNYNNLATMNFTYTSSNYKVSKFLDETGKGVIILKCINGETEAISW